MDSASNSELTHSLIQLSSKIPEQLLPTFFKGHTPKLELPTVYHVCKPQEVQSLFESLCLFSDDFDESEDGDDS
jgi:hypothetical protein